MKKACIVTADSFYRNNRLFALDDRIANRDNCLLPFYALKQQLKESGFDLATSDLHSAEDAELVIYNEMPARLPAANAARKSYLLLFESELIRPDNWQLESHRAFHKIFTWHDDFVDNKKYFKMNFAFQLPEQINRDLAKKDKFCALIAGHKRVDHPLELYSKRVEAIRWFEHNHPQQFDLYGIGWDRYRFSGPKLWRALNRIGPLTRLLAQRFPSYRGRVEEKKSLLEQYRFSICFENARDIPGYITEKIFDCFFAGCIPVYWGAGNILDHIPAQCFVDMRNFSSYEDLYLYLAEMTDEEYQERLEAIQGYLSSAAAQEFSVEYFVDTIIQQVTA